MIYLFIGSILIYLAISIKITFWQTISRCGFKSETPVYYLMNPMFYKIVSFVLFLTASVFAIYQHFIPVWFAVIIPIIFFFITSIIGRNLGIKKLREILKELADNSDKLSKKKEIEEQLNLNDVELFNQFSIKLK